MVTINKIIIGFVIILLVFGCFPPSAVVKPYINGKQAKSIDINNSKYFFNAHTKQLSAIYIENWFEIMEGDNIAIDPTRLKIILKDKEYDFSIEDKSGNLIKSNRIVEESNVYTINSYFDNMFLNVNDTIIMELNGFITVNNKNIFLPPIQLVVDSLIRAK